MTQTSVVNWYEIDRRLRPGFGVFLDALQTSLSYPFVREVYDHTMSDAVAFVTQMLSSDPKHRYDSWTPNLVAALESLETLGITGYPDLVQRIDTREGVETLLDETGMPLEDFTGLIYFLRYWLLPMQQPVRALFDARDIESKVLVKRLKDVGITGILDLLEHARTREGRRVLAERAGIPEPALLDAVHRADMTRLPFTSRKTIDHLIHGGAHGMATLAAMDPDALNAAVLAYGQTIGKDLRFGVEAGNSARVARLLPVVVEV